MKEFVTKRGGRHLFNEDFDNLQDTILGIAEFFKACGDEYIISGCEKDGDYINGGYVFLDGKIRKVERTDVSSLEPPYAICAYDVEYTREYQKGNNDVVAVDYKTTIVSAADELPSAPCIFVDYDSYGSDEFPDVRNLFWGKFCVVDSGSDTTQAADNITVGSKIGTKEFFISGKNGTISTSVKDDGTFVIKLLKPIEISRIEIAPSGMPVSFYNNNTLAYQIGTKEGVIRIILAAAKAINGDMIDATQYLINNEDINDLYFKQSEYIDTGWQGIVNTDTDQPLTDFFARRILDVVYIQGTLPADFIACNFPDNYSRTRGTFVTKYKLPESVIGTNKEYLPTERNFCHLHTIAYVNYRYYTAGVIEVNHTIGCAVRINGDGAFCIYQGVANGKAEDLYDNSVPVHNGYGSYMSLNSHSYDEPIRPHVSWQYGTNLDLNAVNVRYYRYELALYNPAPGYIIDDIEHDNPAPGWVFYNNTFSGYIIHSWCYKSKYTNDGSGEKLSQMWSFTLKKIEYRLKHKVKNYNNIIYEQVFTYDDVWDSDWKEYTPIKYDGDLIDWQYYIGSETNPTGWKMCTSGGHYFKNPDPTKLCQVRLTYVNDELGETSVLYINEIDTEPESLLFTLSAQYHAITPSSSDSRRYAMTPPSYTAKERYFYQKEIRNSSSVYSYTATRDNNIVIDILEGDEYVEKNETTGKLQFTAAGLAAKTKFTLRLRASMRYKGMPDLELAKEESMEIDATKYKLVNE